MGLEISYDAFVGLTFGFFVAVVTVRTGHGMGSGLDMLRQRLRRRNGGQPQR